MAPGEPVVTLSPARGWFLAEAGARRDSPERAWGHLHEGITRNQPCAAREGLVDLVLAWLSDRSHVEIGGSVDPKATAAGPAYPSLQLQAVWRCGSGAPNGKVRGICAAIRSRGLKPLLSNRRWPFSTL